MNRNEDDALKRGDEPTQYVNVENPERKNHGSPQTPKHDHYMMRATMRVVSNNFKLIFFALRRLQQRYNALCLSFSLSHSMSLSLSIQNDNNTLIYT